MYNMHIKWKQKTCRIQLWHKKWYLWPFFWENFFFLKFSPLFWQEFFFRNSNFLKFFYKTPKFTPYTNFKHLKWKLHGGLTLLALCHAEWRAVKHNLSWFLPTPGLFRVNQLLFQLIRSIDHTSQVRPDNHSGISFWKGNVYMFHFMSFHIFLFIIF